MSILQEIGLEGESTKGGELGGGDEVVFKVQFWRERRKD